MPVHPRQGGSSQRLRQESNEHAATAVVITPGSKLSQKKEVKKSYSMHQRAAVPETSAGSKKDEKSMEGRFTWDAVEGGGGGGW